jgi:hypothetical protein
MKPKIYLLLLILSFLSLNISAQQLSLQWAQQFGGTGWDYVNSMVTDSVGNYILGGSLKGTLKGDTTQPGLAYSNNAYLAACDTNGKILWQKTFGGKMFSNITSLSKMPTGILLSGIFQDTIRFDSLLAGTSAYTGAYLASVNEKGNPLWLRKTGGLATIKQILVSCSPHGQVYMAGTFADSLQLAGTELALTGEKGFFMATLIPDGSESKPLVFKGTGICTLGGIVSSDSLVCLAGSFSDTLHINDTILVSYGEEDAFVAQFTPAGKLKHLITAGGIGNEQIRSLAISPTGEIGITGSYDHSILMQDQILLTKGGKDIFVAVIDTAGKLKWLRSIGGLGNDYGYTITTNSNNDYFVSGNFVHNIQMPDENGNIVDMDAGSAFGNAFIAKYNSAGELKASFNLPATSEDYCQSLIVENEEMITAAGNFYQLMQIPKANGDTVTLTTKGERDIFLLRFKDLCKGVSIDVGQDTAFCPGQSLYLSGPKSYPFYRWLPGGLPNRGLEVTKEGSYRLLVTDINGCIASDSLNIVLRKLPVAEAGNDTTIAAGEQLKLDVATVENSTSVEWKTDGSGYFGDADMLSTWYSPSYTDISNGKMLLILSATNQCGTFENSLELSIKQDDDGITAFPNPTSGLVTLVSTKGITIKSVSITTQSGTVVKNSIPVNGTVFQYNLSSFPPGTFLFHLTTGSTILTKIINKY